MVLKVVPQFQFLSVQLVHISTTFHVWVDEWGLYRTSFHGIYKATYNWELVDKYYFTFGLMNGGYIELVFMGFIKQLITGSWLISTISRLG